MDRVSLSSVGEKDVIPGNGGGMRIGFFSITFFICVVDGACCVQQAGHHLECWHSGQYFAFRRSLSQWFNSHSEH